jgi:hypothetical protein
MTYQSSFAKETGTPVAAELTALGWLTGESGDSPRGISRGAGGRTGEQPRRRVPDRDIVEVGARPTGVLAGEMADPPNTGLATNSSEPTATAGAMRRRNLTGPLLALLILELAGFGGNYLRKLYVESQVIVVPPTASERSMIG